MKTVHQHPDGNIFVRVDGALYVDTPDNFKSDFGVQDWPALPDGFEERIYDQGRRHLVQGRDELGGAKIEGQEMPWPLGDEIISKIEAALATKKARDEAALAAKRAEEQAAWEAHIAKLTKGG